MLHPSSQACLETGPTDTKVQVLKATNRHPSPFARAVLAVEARSGVFSACLSLLERDEPEKIQAAAWEAVYRTSKDAQGRDRIASDDLWGKFSHLLTGGIVGRLTAVTSEDGTPPEILEAACDGLHGVAFFVGSVTRVMYYDANLRARVAGAVGEAGR